jgi:hypothetical protein
MRKFLEFCAASTVDDVQPLTNALVPVPPSCLIEDVYIPDSFNNKSASHIISNLGTNLKVVGGKSWWQWRWPGSVVRAEWVEMKADREARKRNKTQGNKVMFYIHGGA